MRGELNANRYNMSAMLSKGDVTPGTPASSVNVRHPPSYQRMHSNESAKSGDKDGATNGSGNNTNNSGNGGGGGKD